MKKLALIVLLAVGLSAQAQEQKTTPKTPEQKERMTPEQREQLRLKKLTNELGLNEKQQKEIGKLMTEQREKREKMRAERDANKEKGVKLTGDERFAMKNKMLDEEKELKDKVQKILTPEQFKKWEEMKNNNRENMKERMEKRAEKKDQKNNKE